MLKVTQYTVANFATAPFLLLFATTESLHVAYEGELQISCLNLGILFPKNLKWKIPLRRLLMKTWKIHKVLRDRQRKIKEAIEHLREVYFDYMGSFHVDETFQQGVISEIEVRWGPYGELHCPSYPVKHGWRYPCMGEF
ncbi:hypothetical protein C5167_021421 [Papaver somniferum]|nr:hypothetical protein C5167_021421 [Papaver somniferum]